LDNEKPKSITIQNEMGVFRECWKWGIVNSYLLNTPKLPFHNENLIPDESVRRDKWEQHEWKSFTRKLREWLKEQYEVTQEQVWDSWVSYQILFFLSNTELRVGECMKLRRKDVQIREYKGELTCLIKVHKSTKTGFREVNGRGG